MLFDYYTIIGLAGLSALLSLLLEFCFRKEMVFSGWLEFWADWWLSRNDPDELNLVEDMSDQDAIELTDGEYETAREYKFSKVKWWFFKPLGYCVVCMNVWVSFVIVSLFLVAPLDAFYCVLLSSFLVRYFHKKLL